MLAQLKKGFTLIELLIVIAIIALLAVVVLFILSPAQQLAKGRDAGRATTVSQLGESLAAYQTSRATAATPLPAEGSTWIDTLVTAGELGGTPALIANSAIATAPCGGALNQNNWCYDATATAPWDYVVYTRLEARINNLGASPSCAVASAWQVYSSANSGAGRYCGASAPTPGTTLTFY